MRVAGEETLTGHLEDVMAEMEEAEAEEKAVQKANAAITAFEKEEEHQNEAMAEFTSSHASP